MRDDMAKVVTERPRRGHGNASKKTTGPRIRAYDPDRDDDEPTRLAIARGRQYGYDCKEFSDLLGPARVLARIAAVLERVRFARITGTTAEFSRVVIIAIAGTCFERCWTVVAIQVVVSAALVFARAETFLIARVVVAGIEIHIDLPRARRSLAESPRIPCDRFVTDVRGFRWSAVAADRQKPK